MPTRHASHGSDADEPRENSVSAGVSDVPPSVSGPGPAAAGIDPGGMDGPEPDPAALERAKAAAADTVAGHLRAKANGRGSRARAGVPLAPLGVGAGAALLEGDPADGDAPGLVDGGEDFDEDFYQAGAELAVDSLNDGTATLMEFYALHQLRDAEKAAQCAVTVRMTPRREERMRKAIVRLARRNPERAAKIFGGLLFWDPALWLADVGKQFRAVAEAGRKLRETPAPAASPSATMTAAGIPESRPPSADFSV